MREREQLKSTGTICSVRQKFLLIHVYTGNNSYICDEITIWPLQITGICNLLCLNTVEY